MKSDKEFIEGVYRKVAILKENRIKAAKKAQKIRRTVITALSLALVAAISVSAWRITINDIRYKASHPDMTRGSTISSNTEAKLSRTTLINRSDLIVMGTVSKRIGSGWNNPRMVLGNDVDNDMSTFWLINLTETYKGVPVNGKSIILSTPGGRIGEQFAINKSFPEIKVGDRVILFVMRREVRTPLTFYPYKDSYQVLGGRQGMYFFDKESGLFSSGIAEPLSNSTIDPTSFKDEVQNNPK